MYWITRVHVLQRYAKLLTVRYLIIIIMKTNGQRNKCMIIKNNMSYKIYLIV